MKNYYSLLLVLTCTLSSCSIFKSATQRAIDASFFRIEKTDAIYFGKFEVTNGQYKAFLSDMKQQDAELYKRCYVDSSQWLRPEFGSYMEPVARNYFSHRVFDHYPVVNISHFGAEQYCLWLTRKAQAKGEDVIFRLPTEDEYKRLLSTVTIKYDSDDHRDYNGAFSFNLGFKGAYGIDGGIHTVSAHYVRSSTSNDGNDIKKYIQNRFKAYHIVGNVEEFLDNGQSIGGSWFSKPSKTLLKKDYPTPDPRVGFRVVMVGKD